MKIQAWENHEKRKAEMEMKRMEVLRFIIYFLQALKSKIVSLPLMIITQDLGVSKTFPSVTYPAL